MTQANNVATESSQINSSGILQTAGGGTGTSSTPTSGGIVYGTGSAYGITSAGTSGQALISSGSGAPTWGVAGATVATTSTNATYYPVFNSATSGSLTTASVNSNFTVNPSTGTVAASGFTATSLGFNSTSTSVLGSTLPYATATVDLGSTTYRWRNIYTNDLHLSNGIGDYTIVEGEDELFLYNNKKGKVYKFALIEVEASEAPAKARSE